MMLRHIKNTLSVCPTCLTKVPAEVFERNGQVFLRKSCVDHGAEEVLVASDARFYWDDSRKAGACATGCSLGHSCTLIFEITEKCNLTCPTCFTASSPHESWSMTLEDFGSKLERLLAAGRSDADLVQISGGEPTIHPDLEQMIEMCFTRGVKRVYVNTNGVRLGKEPAFAERLGRLNRGEGRLQLYLQFDGLRDETSGLIRGRRGLSKVK
ncbi:MAG: radical SAM protein, partial [Polyangiaceae bacterium]